MSEHQHSTTQDYIVEEFEEEIQTNPTSPDLPSSNFTPQSRNFAPLQLRKFTPLTPPTEVPPLKFAPDTPTSPPFPSFTNIPPTIASNLPAVSSNVYITTVSSSQSNVPPFTSNFVPTTCSSSQSSPASNISSTRSTATVAPHNVSSVPSTSNATYTPITPRSISSATVSNAPSTSSYTYAANTSHTAVSPPNVSSIPSTSSQTYAPNTNNSHPSVSRPPSTSTDRFTPPNKSSPTKESYLPSPDEITLPSHAPLSSRQGTLYVGWRCPLCTLVNTPTRLICAACMNMRPENYRVPESYEKREKVIFF